MRKWTVAYELDDESFTGSICSIWEAGTPYPKPDAKCWAKTYIAEDELGAYLQFVRWFDTAHMLYKLKTEGAKKHG